jgi:WD40 repeat protein
MYNLVLVLQGNLVAVGTFRGSVQVWNTDVNQQIYEIQGHAARVGALSWNGNVLSSGSFDTCILHHDIRAPNRVTVTRFVGHQLEVSRNVFKYY